MLQTRVRAWDERLLDDLDPKPLRAAEHKKQQQKLLKGFSRG